MMKTDQRIDAYIEKQATFAQPILRHLRSAVHEACPEAEETMKWSFPHFLYKGQILASMAAFKQHATFGFWKGSLVVEPSKGRASGMGQFGRIQRIEDLPEAEALLALIRKAAALTESGVKAPRNKQAKPPLDAPEDLRVALENSPAASATFESFPPSAKRDYVDWITSAKREETRRQRLQQAIAWMAEGKRRNWKYENC